MIVTHCAAVPMSAPTTRPMYMLAGVMIMPTNSAPNMAFSPNPSSQWSGGGIRSRNCLSSLSSFIARYTFEPPSPLLFQPPRTPTRQVSLRSRNTSYPVSQYRTIEVDHPCTLLTRRPETRPCPGQLNSRELGACLPSHNQHILFTLPASSWRLGVPGDQAITP